MKKHFLRDLGVFGFDHAEPVILAALITEEPLLLIGKAGTGKTFLLNSLSEALNLEHRHYNASFLSFDDLIGFPLPDQNNESVRFLQTPATIWKAQSVLIDELSRCRPETQNKFFSLIHERRVQGMALEHLRYRWAAMNPVAKETDSEADHYEGSIALDQALADRFAFILTVPDWKELAHDDQELVINPAGEAAVNAVAGELISQLKELRAKFLSRIKSADVEIILYCRLASTLLSEAGYRISPRRARLLARNITAILVSGEALNGIPDSAEKSKLFRLALTWSLPHRAWLGEVPSHVIDAAHTEAARNMNSSDQLEHWLTAFRLQTLQGKINMILNSKSDKDMRSLGIIQFLHRATADQAAIFAFSLLPALEKADLVTDEALNKVATIALEVIHVNGVLEWQEKGSTKLPHPVLSRCISFLDTLNPKQTNRISRTRQLFLYLILRNVDIPEPAFTEEQLSQCFEMVRNFLNTKPKTIHQPL